jgi:hypothetical protein
MPSATLIEVDFQTRTKISSRSLDNPEESSFDLAYNKRLINDLKAMLDSVVDQIDLSQTMLLIPSGVDDMYTNINGSALKPSDLENIARIQLKMRNAYAAL